MSGIILDNLNLVEGISQNLANIKAKLEERINLKEYSGNIRPVVMHMTTVMRTCALVGLSSPGERPEETILNMTMNN